VPTHAKIRQGRHPLHGGSFGSVDYQYRDNSTKLIVLLLNLSRYL